MQEPPLICLPIEAFADKFKGAMKELRSSKYILMLTIILQVPRDFQKSICFVASVSLKSGAFRGPLKEFKGVPEGVKGLWRSRVVKYIPMLAN